jgi:hypothetical protein
MKTETPLKLATGMRRGAREGHSRTMFRSLSPKTTYANMPTEGGYIRSGKVRPDPDSHGSIAGTHRR